MQPFVDTLYHVINLVNYTLRGDTIYKRNLFILASETFNLVCVTSCMQMVANCQCNCLIC